MTLGQGLIIGAIVVLLVVSAFFSGSETAITASSRARMHSLGKRGNWRAELVNRLMDKRERLIGALLLGNSVVNIAASTLATGLFLELFGNAGVAYATLVMTVLVVIFAEVLPKTYAINKPDRMSLAVAPSVNFAVAALAPLVSAVQAVVRLLLWTLGAGRRRPARRWRPTKSCAGPSICITVRARWSRSPATCWAAFST